ncbi:MAG: TPR end-of-group domain-containing protein [Myxococcales bacterium]
MQLRAFLGASDDGAYAFAEVTESPGAALRARKVAVDARGKEVSDLALEPASAQAAVAAAARAGDAPGRTVGSSLGSESLEGFSRERATWMAAAEGSTRWVLEPVQGAPCELVLLDEEAELRISMRLAGGGEELVLYRLPKVGRTRIEGVLILPGSRRGLARTLSAWSGGDRLYRLEGLAELELGAALATLLDARAVRALQAGQLEQARVDLERAVHAAPRDAIAHYNLACAWALLGEEDKAILALGKAIDLEPELLRAQALRDPDLDGIRHRVELKLMIEPRADDLGE